MAYEKVFESSYPNGWKDQPDKSTPAYASTFDGYDEAIEHIEEFLDGSTAVKPIAKTEEMTQAVGVDSETGALFTTPGGGGSGEAEDISYDNTESGLESDNVQGAIDELAAGAGSKVTPVEKTEDMIQPVGIDEETGELWTSPKLEQGGYQKAYDKLLDVDNESSQTATSYTLSNSIAKYNAILVYGYYEYQSKKVEFSGEFVVDDSILGTESTLLLQCSGANSVTITFSADGLTISQGASSPNTYISKVFGIRFIKLVGSISGDTEEVVLYDNEHRLANDEEIVLSDSLKGYSDVIIHHYYAYQGNRIFYEHRFDCSYFSYGVTTDRYWCDGDNGQGGFYFYINGDGDTLKVISALQDNITQIVGVRKKAYNLTSLGLIRWFDAIENSDDGYDPTTTTWKDLCGNSDATVSSSASWVDYKFIPGQAIINDFAYNTESDLTLEAYVTLGQNANQYQGILNNQNISLQINNANRIEGVVSGSPDIRAIADASFGGAFKKVLIDVCYDTANKKMLVYVNGEKAAEAEFTSILTDNKSFYIGNFYGQSTYTFRGAIHDIKIYSRVLLPAEIRQNYQYDLHRFSGLVAGE